MKIIYAYMHTARNTNLTSTQNVYEKFNNQLGGWIIQENVSKIFSKRKIITNGLFVAILTKR